MNIPLFIASVGLLVIALIALVVRTTKQVMLERIADFYDILNALALPWFQFADRAKLSRRIGLGVTFYLSVHSVWWAFGFADANAGRGGSELGFMIAAVTAPIAGLQAFVFKWYMADNPGGAAPTSIAEPTTDPFSDPKVRNAG